MKKFAKIVRIVFMIWGLFIWAGLGAMLLIPDGRKSLIDPNGPLPPFLVVILVILLILVGLFLFVYNIICLAKGVDVFYQLIFHRGQPVGNKKPTPYKTTSTPKPAPKVNNGDSFSNGGLDFSKLNPEKPKSNGGSGGKKYSSREIIDLTVGSCGDEDIYHSDAYIRATVFSIKETSNNCFKVLVNLDISGTLTYKTESDISDFKYNSQRAVDRLLDKIANDLDRERNE